jgi:hypothetical protein
MVVELPQLLPLTATKTKRRRELGELPLLARSRRLLLETMKKTTHLR